MDHFNYLYVGLHGYGILIPWMWASVVFMGLAILLLLVPLTRNNEKILSVTCVLVISGTWIDKGMGLVTGGYVPSPLHKVTEYTPTVPELVISLGVYGIGLLVLTVLLKIAIGVKEETRI